MFLRMCVASFLFVFVLVPSVLGFDNKMANNISQQPCPPVYCTNGTHPVFCSRTIIDGCGQPNLQIKIENGTGRWYEAHHLEKTSLPEELTLAITNREVCKSLNDSSIHNISALSMTSNMITLLKCNETSNSPFELEECGNWSSYRPYDKKSKLEPNCSVVHVPWIAISLCHDLFTLGNNTTLLDYFHIKCPWCGRPPACPYQYQCVESVDSKPQPNAEEPKDIQMALKIGLGLGLGIPGIMMATLVIKWYIHKRRKVASNSNFLLASSASDLTTSRSFYFLGVCVFSYKELEEATNKFDPEKRLGDGGFGTVYYGKLRDGREVAVKRLYEHNYRRVEQFMNEIKILSCLRHRNLVSLYGCTSRNSRELLLVYEYIPNGTVAQHLHSDSANSCHLNWSHRMTIATETASALAYLHHLDIIHRDVKTDNILLDTNFCVKVADFGLSRLFPTDVTHISTTPQGTPGYIDPEYHQCYQLTSKSDVYSFGVVLIELISSMPAVDITRHKHEINLASLAITKIQQSAVEELIDPRLGFNSDGEVKRMATCVAELAFRCLQQDKELRPSIHEVLEELERIKTGHHDSEETYHARSFDSVELQLSSITDRNQLTP